MESPQERFDRLNAWRGLLPQSPQGVRDYADGVNDPTPGVRKTKYRGPGEPPRGDGLLTGLGRAIGAIVSGLLAIPTKIGEWLSAVSIWLTQRLWPLRILVKAGKHMHDSSKTARALTSVLGAGAALAISSPRLDVLTPAGAFIGLGGALGGWLLLPFAGLILVLLAHLISLAILIGLGALCVWGIRTVLRT